MSGFQGFPPGALDFLRALSAHQSREWFQGHREVFEATLQQPLVALVDAVSEELARREVPLKGVGQKSLFRMNRDVRFSRDKSPYKTNLGAVLSRDGSKRSPGLLYLHLDPRGCFVAAGVYQPEPEDLKRIRRRVVEKPRAFRAATARLAKAGLELDAEAALKRLPKGFEAVEGEDLQAAVRLKNFIVMKPVSEAALGKGKVLVATAAGVAEASLPLLRFCWDAVSGR